jgi:hypothetical protein
MKYKMIMSAILMVVFGQSLKAQNVISNGNFETSIDNWSGYNNQVLQDNLTNSSVGNVNNDEGSLRQVFSMIPGTTYNVTFDYRWVSGAGNFNMTVLVKTGATGGSNLQSLTLNTTPDQWDKGSFTFTASAAMNEARIIFYKAGGNRPLRIDNVVIIDADFVPTFVDNNTPVNAQPEGNVPGNWVLDFSDEFVGDNLDLTKWYKSVSTKSRAPRENLGVTDWRWISENAFLNNNGQLVLRATKLNSNTMRCGSIESRGLYEVKYGYLEARIKIAKTAKGNHTAFWLQGGNQSNVDNSAADGAEVDIFESAWTTNTSKAVVHYDGYNNDTKKNHTIPFNTPNIHNEEFHTFGLLWTENSMDVFYDGVKVTSTQTSKPFPFSTNPTNGHDLVPKVKEWLWLSVGASFGDGDFQSQSNGFLSDAIVEYVRVFKPSPLISSSQNLISNGGLEDGDISPFTSIGGGVSTPTGGEIFSGTYSMNLGNDFKQVKQNITAITGVKYQLSFYARYNNSGINTGGEAFVTIRTDDGSVQGNVTVGSTTIPVATTDWTYFTYTFTAPQTALMFFVSKNPRSGGGTNNSIRFDNISIRPLATWQGDDSTDWATASNWDINTVPTSTGEVSNYDVLIPSTGVTAEPLVSSTTGAFAFNLEVDVARTLTINGGGSLDVDGTPVGNITYKRTLQAGKWHLVASPVIGETYDDAWVAANGIASGTGNNKGVSMYQNGAADPTTGQWVYMQSGGSDTFGSSTGYSLRTTATGIVSFTGEYPTAAKPAAVDIEDNAFNLVGNPYPTYLSVGNFFTNNPSTTKLSESTIWLWDQSANTGAGGYIPTTSSDGGFIAPGQAFFVSAAAATDIIFYQFNGQHHTDSFLKLEKTKVLVSIASNDISSNTEVHYLPEGTNDFDNGYDASKFSGVASSFSLYTAQISDINKKLGRQVVSLSDMENIVVPIGVKADADSEIMFSAVASNLSSGLNVYLEDRLLNTTTRIDDGNYSVTLSEAVNGVGRFYMHTTSSALGIDNLDIQNVSIYKTTNSTLRIVGLSNGKSNLKLFNILGKEVMNQNFESKNVTDVSLPKLAKGIYIAQLQTEKGNLNKKIILE